MPEDMGIVGILTIFSTIAAALTESGFVSALSIQKSISHRDYNAVFWFCIIVGSILYLLLFIASPLISVFFEIPELKNLSRVSFLNFFISSFGIAHSACLNRNLQVRERAISTTIGVVIGGVSGIFAAFLGAGYWALVIQNLVYCTLVNAGFTYFSRFRPTLTFDLQPIRRLLAYSSKLLITNVFININNNFLTATLGKYYATNSSDGVLSTATAGQYNQANKWNLMGQTFILSISNTLIQPLMTEVSQSDEQRRARVFRKLLAFISFMTFPVMFGLSLISYDFITITIGEKWLDSAGFLRILSIGGAFAVVSNAFSNYILSLGRSLIYMWNIIIFGLLQIAVFVGFRSLGISNLILIYSGLNIIWLNTWYFICRKSLGYGYRFLFRDVYLYAITAGISYLGTMLWTDSISNAYLRLSSNILSMGVVYLALCFLHSREIFIEIKKFFLKKL